MHREEKGYIDNEDNGNQAVRYSKSEEVPSGWEGRKTCLLL